MARFGEASDACGAIVGFTTSPEGAMNGFTLDSGATVNFPLYAGAQLLPFVARGARVLVSGMIRAGARGPVLEAARVTNQGLGCSVDVAAIPPPAPLGPAWQAPPPRGAVAPPGAPPLTPPTRAFP
jgi:hypothetical protein